MCLLEFALFEHSLTGKKSQQNFVRIHSCESKYGRTAQNRAHLTDSIGNDEYNQEGNC